MQQQKEVTVGDLVELNPMEPVVQLSQVRDLRGKDDPFLFRLIDSFILEEGAHAAPFEGLLQGLVKGGAFLISGIYGSGKSHLLSLLGLIAQDPALRDRFALSHPEWSLRLRALERNCWRTVYCPLDEYDPNATSLEEAVRREVAKEWSRWGDDGAPQAQSRSDWLDAILSSRGDAKGVLFLLDDLALFLNGRTATGFVGDASFLQFLAQAASRRPVTLVGVLQRGWEEVHPHSSYTWTQVRDRFEKHWLLSLAHTRTMVDQVLISKKDPALLHSLLQKLSDHYPHLKEHPIDRLMASYPFHCDTLWCAERATRAFFSRTRSVVTYVQDQVSRRLSDPWDRLITPDTLVDHFHEDMASHPELRVYVRKVLPHFEVLEAESGRGGTVRLVKVLLAYQLSGSFPSAARLGATLGLPAETVWHHLEKLREEGDFLVQVHRSGSPDDTYRLTPTLTANRALRERVTHLMAALAPGDARLIAFATDCRSEDWLLPPPDQIREISIRWQQTKRLTQVTLTDLRKIKRESLLHLLKDLEEGVTRPQVHLFLALPLATTDQRTHIESLRNDDDSLNRVGFWIPAEPGPAEWIRWRENTALWLLSQDRSLEESEQGRLILDRARERLEVGRQEMVAIFKRLYNAGTLIVPGKVRPQNLPLRPLRSSEELVETAAGAVLDGLYPEFSSVAPKREATGQTVHFLTRLILKGLPESEITGSVSRWLEAVAVPLGICSREQSGWKVHPPKPAILRKVMDRVAGDQTVAEAGRALREPPLGLTSELATLVLSGLIRVGILAVKDRSGDFVAPQNVSVPFPSHLRLTVSSLLEEQDWQAIRPYLKVLLGAEPPQEMGHLSQQESWDALQKRGGEWQVQLQEIRPRLLQWWRERGEAPRSWSRSLEVFQSFGDIISIVVNSPTAHRALTRLLSWFREHRLSPKDLENLLEHWSRLQSLATHLIALTEAARYLSLLDPSSLPERERKIQSDLLTDYRNGDWLLQNADKWLQRFYAFRERYIDVYVRHHEEVNGGALFRKLESLKESPEVLFLRAVCALEGVPTEAVMALNLLRETLGSFCPDGPTILRPSLNRTPFCPRCQVKLTDRARADPDRVADAIREAADVALQWLNRSDVASVWRPFLLARNPEVSPPEPDAPLPQWLPFMDSIRLALTPKTVVTLSASELTRLFIGRFLKSEEALDLFRRWLIEKGAESGTFVQFIDADQREEGPDTAMEKSGHTRGTKR